MMLDQYLSRAYKPLMSDDQRVQLFLTRGSRTAMKMLAEHTLRTLKDPDVSKVMMRVDKAVCKAIAESVLEVDLRWEDFKIFHMALEKKMAHSTVKESIDTRLAQQELLDCCYEAEYKTIVSKRKS